MTEFYKYPHLENLNKCPEILEEAEVVICEKIHGCVPANTGISMADGTRKHIRNIAVGDHILGADASGAVVTTTVTQVFDNGLTDSWLRFSGKRRGLGRGNATFTLRCTEKHRLWSAVKNEFVTADTVSVGDSVTMIRSELGLTPLQEQVLLGKMLGDGSLQLDAHSAHLAWGHRATDQEYSAWTSRALGDIDSATVGTATSGFGSPMVRGRTVQNFFIRELLEDFLVDGQKTVPNWVASALTPIAIAFWYMDDGSLAHNEGQEDRAYFATCGFTQVDCDILTTGLARLGMTAETFQDPEGYYRVRLKSDASEALFLMIAPYVPPCMQRKLPERYRGHTGWLPRQENQYKPKTVELTIDAIAKEMTRPGLGRKLDIETSTHNYFANGILVHNSNMRVFAPCDGLPVRFGSRNHDVTDDASKFYKGKPVQYFLDRPKFLDALCNAAKYLGQDVTLYGEIFGSPIQKGVKYFNDDEIGFRVFDVRSGEKLLSFDDFVDFCEEIGAPIVPPMYIGAPSLALFDELVIQQSGIGCDGKVEDPANTHEGIVIRPTLMKKVKIGGGLEWMIVKHKSPKFVEEQGHKSTTLDPEKLEKHKAVRAYVEHYCTPGRLLNVIGHLKDTSSLSMEMSDMPKLVPAMVDDILLEDSAIPEGVSKRDVHSCVGNILGNLYRRYLIEQAGNK